MVFVGGLFIGVLIFALGYNIWEKMYLAKFLGSPKVSTVLGLSDGIFAFLLIIAALAMFWVAEWAEKRFPIADY
jgi:hypothetical protein